MMMIYCEIYDEMMMMPMDNVCEIVLKWKFSISINFGSVLLDITSIAIYSMHLSI